MPVELGRSRRDSLAYLLLTVAALFWAINWVVGRAMRDAMPPVAMGFWRWTIALAILLPIALPELRERWDVVRRNWLILAALGAIGAAGFNTLVYVGVSYTPASSAVLFNSLSPVLIILLSWIALGERPTAVQLAGVVVSFCGIATISTHGNWSALGGVGVQLTDLWLVLAMILWAVFTILLRWRPPQLSAIGFLCATTFLGLPALIPFYLWEFADRGGFELDALNIATLLFYGTVPSILAYLCWNHGVARVGANRAGLFTHLIPAFGVLLAVIFLNERLEIYHFAGIFLIFGGIYLTTIGRPAAAI